MCHKEIRNAKNYRGIPTPTPTRYLVNLYFLPYSYRVWGASGKSYFLARGGPVVRPLTLDFGTSPNSTSKERREPRLDLNRVTDDHTKGK